MFTLPSTAFNLLPFTEEPIAHWGKDTDARTFAHLLYLPRNESHGLDLFSDKEKEIRKYSIIFTKNILESTEASICIDFRQDKTFGKIAKYSIAFKCCTQQLLEDAGFYSLAHVLEAESDLECSLLLASNFYYKQAASMLRNILEEVFLPIHFCDNISDFNEWKSNNFRTPNLRGNNGLISRLLRKNIIKNPLATRISNLYGSLSAYVHGSEQTLIHQNAHLGERREVEYNQQMFSTWGQLFCECIDVCMLLLKINYDQWHIIRASKFESLAQSGKTLCSRCHNEDSFERWLLPSKYCYIEKEDEESNVLANVENLSFYRYICQICNNEIIVNSKETDLNIIMCFSTDDVDPGNRIKDYAHLVRGTNDPYGEWYTVQLQNKNVLAPFFIPLPYEKK